MADRTTGTVKWFDAKKGFGFITSNSDRDIFVHYSSIRESGGFRTLEEGQQVEFTLNETEKGPHAQDVVPV
ncbi:MAG: cold shock domain-containing protein [Calditrichia bacterium]|nr:cold shock domain-containing protein [Calditrichota bacterium]MCB0267515.1 cold shock domain-containing protein [Calditrichota bacterium]MCB9067478.1 cold shock domain-containing protein [Calditrichia bacterium]